MFDIKWVAHGHETNPVEIEHSTPMDLDIVVSTSIERLPAMRRIHAHMPPDGFIVVDNAGTELRRWFGSARPDAGSTPRVDNGA